MPKKNLTILGFDFGTKQIGVALGQTTTHSASPLKVVRNHNDKVNWREISEIISDWQPQALVLGLPLNMDGSESEFCATIKKFARQLEGRFNLPVHLIDERLTSAVVKQSDTINKNYVTHPIDDKAAAVILQSWLDENRDTN